MVGEIEEQDGLDQVRTHTHTHMYIYTEHITVIVYNLVRFP